MTGLDLGDAGTYSNKYFAASLQLSTEVGNDLSSHGTETLRARWDVYV